MGQLHDTDIFLHSLNVFQDGSSPCGNKNLTELQRNCQLLQMMSPALDGDFYCVDLQIFHIYVSEMDGLTPSNCVLTPGQTDI